MTTAELWPILPLLILGIAAIAIMLAAAFFRDSDSTFLLTLLGLLAAFGSLFRATDGDATSLLTMDAFSRFFLGLELGASFSVANFVRIQSPKRVHELYLLLMIATLGCATLVMSHHFVSLFLGLEILSVSLYGMVAYFRANEQSVEASIKYLVLAAVSTAFLLFGIALLYTAFGTMEFGQIATRAIEAPGLNALYPTLLITGSALLLVGIGFKLAVVPFHLWTPDVYQGASASVTAFIATASKGAIFALLLRYAAYTTVQLSRPLQIVLTVIAFLSMFIGNLLALRQNNLKRLLAYSSISHFGYMLIAFVAGGPTGSTAILFYLAAYFMTILAAFGVIAVISPQTRETAPLLQTERLHLSEYRGLYWTHPFYALVLTVSLLSLAGIPLTTGFLGKFFVVNAGVETSRWALLIALVINSGIGIYYYLRVIVWMSLPLTTTPLRRTTSANQSLGPTVQGSAVLATLLVLIIALGAYPSPLIQLIQGAAINIGRGP